MHARERVLALGLWMLLGACAQPVTVGEQAADSPGYRIQQLIRPRPLRTFSPGVLTSPRGVPIAIRSRPPWLTGKVVSLIRYETDVEQEIERLTDQARALNGNVSALFHEPKLRDVARAHSRDMADHATLSQTWSDGKTLDDQLRAAGIDFREAAMNIHRMAPGIYAAHDTLRDRLDGWLYNPEASAKLLNAKFEYTGVGVYKGSDGNLYITQILTRRGI